MPGWKSVIVLTVSNGNWGMYSSCSHKNQIVGGLDFIVLFRNTELKLSEKMSKAFTAVKSVDASWDRRKSLDKNPAELRIPHNMAFLENHIYSMNNCWPTQCVSHSSNWCDPAEKDI